MKALIKYRQGPKMVRLEDVPIPEPLENEVRIRVMAAGICGTDLHIYHDDSYPTDPPVILGHEVSGIVDLTGPGVTGMVKGQKCTSHSFRYTCGNCCYCKAGRNNLCIGKRSIGTLENGGFAEYMTVPAANIIPVPETISFNEAAMIEPLACCVQGVFEKSRIVPQDRVAITGPGSIGLLCLQLVKASGAKCIVIGTAQDGEKLKLAKSLGADLTLVNSRDDVAEIVEDYCGGTGPDAFLECSGNEAAVNMGISIIKKGGRYTQVGLFSRPITLDMNAITIKEIVINGTFAAKYYAWETAIRLMEDQQVKVAPLITRTFPLDDWEEAFNELLAGAGVKYLLNP